MSSEIEQAVLLAQQRVQDDQARAREEQEAQIGDPRIPFSREDLINAHTLRTTEFQAALLLTINDACLYESAKRALRTIVLNYFASNWFLANLERGGKLSSSNTDELLGARLGLELDLLFATTSFCPSDIRSPDMIAIIQGIQTHFKPTLSRAKGGDRERKLQGKIETETTLRRIEQGFPYAAPQQPQKKKGWLSFLGW